MSRHLIEGQQRWRGWVTPHGLAQQPVHRWYYFPHSFTPELVGELIKDWRLSPRDSILDPFCGAGTTIVTAKQQGVSATGHDLSPLAAFITKTKARSYDPVLLRSMWQVLRRTIQKRSWKAATRPYPSLVRHALPGQILNAFDTVNTEIEQLLGGDAHRDFFRLALLGIVAHYSRAARTGGMPATLWAAFMESSLRHPSRGHCAIPWVSGVSVGNHAIAGLPICCAAAWRGGCFGTRHAFMTAIGVLRNGASSHGPRVRGCGSARRSGPSSGRTRSRHTGRAA